MIVPERNGISASVESDIFGALAGLAERIAAAPRGKGRTIVAIAGAPAGAPAGGKSLKAHALTTAVNDAGRMARLIPLDGFHLDNAVLDSRGLKAQKGAPETFDAAGFIALVQRIREGGEVFYPLFDRQRDLAVAGAAVIEPDCDIAIFEGNYLLFDEDPWRALRPLWDLSAFIETSEEVVIERCIQRWLDHGHAFEDARKRAMGNDLVNARRVNANRLGADVVLEA